jgi:DNA-binding SARP family transcriptional activator
VELKSINFDITAELICNQKSPPFTQNDERPALYGLISLLVFWKLFGRLGKKKINKNYLLIPNIFANIIRAVPGNVAQRYYFFQLSSYSLSFLITSRPAGWIVAEVYNFIASLTKLLNQNQKFMYLPNVIILGGSDEEIAYVERDLGEDFHLVAQPFHFRPEQMQAKPLPIAILLIHRPPRQNATLKVEQIRKKIPGIPTFVLAYNPRPEDIISIFRSGAADFLIYPPSKDELKSRLRRISFTASPSLQKAPGLRHNLGQSLRRFLSGEWWKEWEGTPALWSPSLGIQPGLDISKPLYDEGKCAHDLTVRFFGRLNIEAGGKKPEVLPAKKTRSLLAYLLLFHQRPVHREILMYRFWGNTSPSSARNSLNVSIHEIRSWFRNVMPGRELILFENESYSVNPELDLATDTGQFTSFWQRGRAIELAQGLESALGAYNKAAALYRGDLLEEMPYEEWCESERENFRETYLLILNRLGAHFFNEGIFSVAIQVYRKMLEKDPCLEDVHRRLIIAYYQMGMRDRAVRQYYKCVQTLQEELQVEPSVQTKELFRRIRKEEIIE